MSYKEKQALSPSQIQELHLKRQQDLDAIHAEPTEIRLVQPGSKRIVQLDDGTPKVRATRSVFTKRGAVLTDRAGAAAQSSGLAEQRREPRSSNDSLVGCTVVRTLCSIAQMSPEQRKYLIGLFHRYSGPEAHRCRCREDAAAGGIVVPPKCYNSFRRPKGSEEAPGTVCRCQFVDLMREVAR